MSELQQPKISPEELKLLQHPTQDSRFDLALLLVIALVSIGFVWIIATSAGILVLLGVIVGIAWLTLQLMKAQLTSNSLKVSPKNFPEVYRLLQEVKHILDYDQPIGIYIVEEGTVNAFLAKFFKTKFIILNSELVRDMLKQDSALQLKWVIARFVGGLKAKHDKFALVRIIISGIEKLQIFNIFLLPYERAIHYSADQIGLAVCGDLNQALIAFQKFMVGNHLASRINPHGVMEQKAEMGFFASWVRLFSTHPHVVDRYANLLAFAEEKYPAMYAAYTDSKS